MYYDCTVLLDTTSMILTYVTVLLIVLFFAICAIVETIDQPDCFI